MPHELAEAFSSITFLEAIIGAGAAAITAVATVYIAKFTVTLARVGSQQVADTRILERAYLSAEPDGVFLMLGKRSLVAHTKIINAGNL
jgi:hypothetical protein